jgi:2-methylcitrate dehydratase PrpD
MPREAQEEEREQEMSSTKILADYVANLRYEDLPPPVVSAVKQCLLDFLGVAFAGSREESSGIMERTCASLLGGSGCNLLAAGFPQAGLLQAAMCNAAFGHALDMDDVHNGAIIHLGAVTIPSGLALGQVRGIGGQAFIASVVAGYEIGARIGLSVNPSSYYFWHTTATVGNFTAAAVCANILALTPAQTVHALGSAGTQAAGLWEFLADGAMSKFLHCGKACINGILSAELAKNGYTAATRILEGDKGFIRAVAPEPNVAALTQGLGQIYMILENSFKPYPCCKHTHPAIYATLKIMEETGVRFADVESIDARVYSVAENLVGNKNPQTSYGCKFSLPYCVAAALFFGDVGAKHFSEECFQDPMLRTMLARVNVIVDRDMEAIFQRNPRQWTQQIEIRTKGGKTIVKRIDFPKGDPENPLSYDETIAKFNKLASGIFTEEERIHIIEKVFSLEALETLSELFPIQSKRPVI